MKLTCNCGNEVSLNIKIVDTQELIIYNAQRFIIQTHDNGDLMLRCRVCHNELYGLPKTIT
jgi:hypothetical protein